VTAPEEPAALGEHGRQAERTVLAHWRTQLAAVVVAMLMVRQAEPGGERWAVAGTAAVAVAIVVVAAFRRQRQLVGGLTSADPVTVHAIAGAVVVLQLAALAVVL
jgi:hypothetical protein